ncbi:MAG: UDP-N-acetylmuramate dehydrogenase [Bacteroidales bacterium]
MLIHKQNTSLKSYNTFGVDVNAKHLIRASSALEVVDYLNKNTELLKIPRMIVGEGSNLLFLADFDGLIIRLESACMNLRELDGSVEIILTASAGVVWDSLVNFACNNKLFGLENLSYIPGTVGASAVQNVGAYGVEAADLIVEVRGYDFHKQEWFSMSAEECKFAYRDSIFKHYERGRILISDVDFRLSSKPCFKLDYGDVRARVEALGEYSATDVRKVITEIRQSKLPDPKDLGSAGSFFKNPLICKEHFERIKSKYPDLKGYEMSDSVMKIHAAWLIDKAGLRGEKVGGAQVYDKQPLVIVNAGTATGGDVRNLAELIQNRVKEEFKIELHPEVMYI